MNKKLLLILILALSSIYSYAIGRREAVSLTKETAIEILLNLNSVGGNNYSSKPIFDDLYKFNIELLNSQLKFDNNRNIYFLGNKNTGIWYFYKREIQDRIVTEPSIMRDRNNNKLYFRFWFGSIKYNKNKIYHKFDFTMVKKNNFKNIYVVTRELDNGANFYIANIGLKNNKIEVISIDIFTKKMVLASVSYGKSLPPFFKNDDYTPFLGSITDN